MTSTVGGRVTRSRTLATITGEPVAGGVSVAVRGGKRKKLDSAVSELNQAKKTKLQSNMNSSTTTSGSSREVEEADMEMKDAAESFSPTRSSARTAAAASSTLPSTTTHQPQPYSSVTDKDAINSLLRQPLPNVLADMVMDYLFHPLFDLWEEVISVYESLPQLPKENEEKKATKKVATASTTAATHSKQPTSQNDQIELMPKLQLSPPSSPMEVDELEQLFQLKYDDPNFHFSSELKFLWSIADGLEASQNMIFHGRFWPSLASMKSILACTENSYYVMYHYHEQHVSGWLKYDFRTNTFYATGSYEDQDHLFEEELIVIVFHSISHFMKALLATLKLAAVNAQTYRIPRHLYPWLGLPGEPHPPAIDVNHARGIVPKPAVDLPDEWEYFSMGVEFQQFDDHQLLPGHLTSAEYLSIRKSLCVHENTWVERLLNLADDERAVNGVYHGFPRISSCHLLDAMDNYYN